MSIASQLQTLAENKVAIKAAIEAKNPSVAPTDVLSNWPSSIASISGGGEPEPAPIPWVKPSDWPDIRQILEDDVTPAAATALGATHKWIMLCRPGVIGGGATGYTFYRNYQVYFRVADSTGETHDIPSSTTANTVITPLDNGVPFWIIVYVNGTSTACPGPSGQPYVYTGPLWVHAPDVSMAGNIFQGWRALQCFELGGWTGAITYIGLYNDLSIYRLRIRNFSATGSLVIGPGGGGDFPCPLTDIDVDEIKGWNVSGLTSARFSYIGVVRLDLSAWNVSNMTSVENAFSTCPALRSINLSGWTLSKATTAANMFNGCLALTEIDMSNVTAAVLSSAANMFLNCYSLKRISFDGCSISGITTLNQTFRNCASLETLDLSGWDVSKVTTMYYAFENCRNMVSVDMTGWDVSKVTDMQYAFSNCRSLREVDFSSWNTGSVTTMSCMFQGNGSLRTVNLSGWNVSKVTTFYRMFFHDISLTSVDVSNWTFGITARFDGMFNYCPSLAEIDISGWSNAVANNMQGMFQNCYSLITADVTVIDTSSAADMSYVFQNCSVIDGIDVSGWDVSHATNMTYLFGGCRNLKSIDISAWNPALVTNTSNMFQDCYSLATIIGGKTVAADGSIDGSTAYFSKGFNINFALNNSNSLDHDSLLFLMYWVPQVSTARTLTIGNTNKAKLSAAEIAIANAKNWTIA